MQSPGQLDADVAVLAMNVNTVDWTFSLMTFHLGPIRKAVHFAQYVNLSSQFLTAAEIQTKIKSLHLMTLT